MKMVIKNFSSIQHHRDQKRCEFDLLSKKRYNESCWARSKTDLAELYNYKCAYCERDLRKYGNITIDHYRPKSKSKYYWLAHEWTNFLPCCTFCQQKKDDNFETAKAPQYNPPLLADGSLNYDFCKADSSYLLAEEPLLLHPEIDNPDDHFVFDENSGELLPKDHSIKAAKTIDLLHLNSDSLCFERKKLVDDFFEELDIWFSELEMAKSGLNIALKIYQEKAKQKSDNAEFSFVWKYLQQSLSYKP